MMRARRILVGALIPAMVLVAASTAATVGREKDKVGVCHHTGNGSSHLITIARQALPAHMRHGDSMPDEYGDCVGGHDDRSDEDDANDQGSDDDRSDDRGSGEHESGQGSDDNGSDEGSDDNGSDED